MPTHGSFVRGTATGRKFFTIKQALAALNIAHGAQLVDSAGHFARLYLVIIGDDLGSCPERLAGLSLKKPGFILVRLPTRQQFFTRESMKRAGTCGGYEG